MFKSSKCKFIVDRYDILMLKNLRRNLKFKFVLFSMCLKYVTISSDTNFILEIILVSKYSNAKFIYTELNVVKN